MVKDIDNLENNQKKFIAAADMKKTKSKGGRPKKDLEDKASEQVFVNLTKSEKDALSEYSKKMKLSISSMIRFTLLEKGII